METGVRKFFQRYERFFNQSLAGAMDMDEVAALYSSAFIASWQGLTCRLELLPFLSVAERHPARLSA